MPFFVLDTTYPRSHVLFRCLLPEPFAIAIALSDILSL